MRPDLSVRYHRYHGKPYWVVKEPIGLKYFRFQEEEFSILQMLDGTISFQEIKDRFEKEYAPQKITLNDLQHFIGMLHRSGLLITNAEGQGRQLKRRRDETKRKELMGKVSNVLAIRFKGIDPEKLLNWMAQYTNWFFTKWAVMGVLSIGLCALLLLGTQFAVFRARLPAFHEFFGPQNWIFLGVTLGLTKVLHEFGHGLSCKRFGGECHEMGVMFLVLTPCLYCNVSDSWLLPSKWHRAAIGAAGMYVEITLATIATFLWWFSEPSSTINQVALSVMFICSVSTVLFNGNPLLRFDGYYILSDLSEIPNLRQKASKILQRYMSEYCLGIEQQEDPFLPQSNQVFFAIYTIAAVIYRWIVVFSILMFLNSVLEPYGLQVLGRVIACAGLFGLVVQPLWQFGKFLHVPGRMHQVKKKNVLITVAVLAALLMAFCYIPLPYSVKCAVQLQPKAAETVFASVPGRLVKVNFRQGDRVEEGDIVAVLENNDLTTELESSMNELERVTASLRFARAEKASGQQGSSSDIAILEDLVRGQQVQVDLIRDRCDRLEIKAQKAGYVIPAPSKKKQPSMEGQLQTWYGSLLDPKNLGATLAESDVLFLIADPKEFEAELAVDQSDIRFIEATQRVRIMMEAYTNSKDVIETEIDSDEDISQEPMQITPEALSMQAGGTIATRTDKTGLHRPLSPTYQVFVAVKTKRAGTDAQCEDVPKLPPPPNHWGSELTGT